MYWYYNRYFYDNLFIDKKLSDCVGLFGATDKQSTIQNIVIKKAEVSGKNNTGMLVGLAKNSKKKNIKVQGKVSGTMPTGGLLGDCYFPKIVSSYWDMQTSMQSTSDGGEGRTSVEMFQRNNYQGWDFTKIWNIKEGEDYPFLR